MLEKCIFFPPVNYAYKICVTVTNTIENELQTQNCEKIRRRENNIFEAALLFKR